MGELLLEGKNIGEEEERTAKCRRAELDKQTSLLISRLRNASTNFSER